MKRIFLSALAALPLAVVPVSVASAHSGGGTTPSVSIQRDAQFDLAGVVIHVGLYVRCTSSTGDGTVTVDVKQYPPETPYPVGTGSGPTPRGLRREVALGRRHPRRRGIRRG
jgi:hypothetical protein